MQNRKSACLRFSLGVLVFSKCCCCFMVASHPCNMQCVLRCNVYIYIYIYRRNRPAEMIFVYYCSVAKHSHICKKSHKYCDTLKGREQSVFNQANIGTVSRATLGRLLRDRAERIWAFPSTVMPSCAWAETETATPLSLFSTPLHPSSSCGQEERRRRKMFHVCFVSNSLTCCHAAGPRWVSSG